MLLGRTAGGLFWMQRYIERAENMARIVDTGLRMALTKTSTAPEEWASVVVSSGTDDGFRDKHERYAADTVADYLLRDRDNPSSALSSIEMARSNARMVRTALTREAWEAVNGAWMAMCRMLAAPVPESDLPVVLDQIKREAALIRGAFHGTMLRNEIYDFARMGTFIERADNTARILDVKYHVLLPDLSYVGTPLDNYQWESILRAVSAHRSYRWVYDVEYKPRNIADYLILHRQIPRSLQFCYRKIVDNLGYLAEDYGETHPCHRTAGETLATLQQHSIDSIIHGGLHEFLTEFLTKNNQLGHDIAEAYKFA